MLSHPAPVKVYVLANVIRLTSSQTSVPVSGTVLDELIPSSGFGQSTVVVTEASASISQLQQSFPLTSTLFSQVFPQLSHILSAGMAGIVKS